MSRRRGISTEISTDPRIADLAQHGPLPLLLYTWAIPHADDWGRLTGDARQFKLAVCPALDTNAREIDDALDQVASVGLWQRYEVDGRKYIAFPTEAWYKHQSYISKQKRQRDGSSFPPPPNTADHRTLPQITEEHSETPQNPVSPSPTPTPSPSPKLSKTPLPHEVDPASDGGGGGNEILRQIDLAHHRSFGGFMSAVTRDKIRGLLTAGMDPGLILKLFENAAMDRKPAAWAIRGLERMLAQGILVPEQSESRRRPPIREDPIDPEALEAFRRFSDKASSQEGRPP